MNSLLIRLLIIIIAALATAAVMVFGLDWSQNVVWPGVITSATLTALLTILDRGR